MQLYILSSIIPVTYRTTGNKTGNTKFLSWSFPLVRADIVDTGCLHWVGKTFICLFVFIYVMLRFLLAFLTVFDCGYGLKSRKENRGMTYC